MAGKKALLVGINKFAKYSQFALNGCVNDAKDMAALYKDLPGFKTSEITILTDAQATKANIGSGWPVNDEQATKLARTFYEALLTGKPICDALQAGRAEISGYGDTWGAYQHYGNPNDIVLKADK